MVVLSLDAYSDNITGILKVKNNSIWVGKVERLELNWYAIEILPKLRIHGENVMEEFSLSAYTSKCIAEILKMKNKSIWIGKVKRLVLEKTCSRNTPQAQNTQGECDGGTWFVCKQARPNHRDIQKKNNSIWVRKVKRLELVDYAVEALPKLRIHEENVMEELCLGPYGGSKHLTKILEMKNKSIRIGKVRSVNLKGHAEAIRDKLDFTRIGPDGQERVAVFK
ncbi:MAG: uncharacterized protein A8A55_1471 [Amphiamblys sp. WSBS2006]|nr:MAG: uncharacterized protein A8A55_1471 [Amphiamblys sp. WSBS2006]